MNEEAQSYLHEALDYIQKHSVKRAAIDWQTWRTEVLTTAAHAQTPAQTYPALKRALFLLGDHHSTLQEPDQARQLSQGQITQFGLRILSPEGIVALVSPESAAEQAGIRVGDRVQTINGQPMASYSINDLRTLLVRGLGGNELSLTITPAGTSTVRTVHLQATSSTTIRPIEGRLLESGMGYLDLPGLLGNEEQATAYAQHTQDLIGGIDQHRPSGWVIDLRRNTGGNMWPMVAGLGPLLGEGAWLIFVAPQEHLLAFYRNGQAGISPDSVLSTVPSPYHLPHSRPPIAVLTSQLTASSGEFTALLFRGLAGAHSFGEPTQGVPTANETKMLRDGAALLLTTALGADRTERTYEGPLQPDCPVTIDWMQVGTPHDPVLQAALHWIEDHNKRHKEHLSSINT